MPALKEIEELAMHLPPRERAALAQHLIGSLEDEGAEAETMWIREAEARYEAWKRGDVDDAPAQTALERARRALR